MSVSDEKMDVSGEGEEEEQQQDPLLEVADLRASLRLKWSDKGKTSKRLLQIIQENDMISFYEATVTEFPNLKQDSNLLATMKTNVDKKRKELEQKKKDAEKTEGEVEVREIDLELAKLSGMSDKKEVAIETYELLLNEKSSSSKSKGLTRNKKIDVSLSILRLALAWEDDILFKKSLPKAQRLVDEAGDWDRRNRLYIYKGCSLLRTRDFMNASKNFLEGISTFNCNELFDYKRFVFLCCISSSVSLNRVELKEKIVNSPEVRSVIESIDNLKNFITSLYECEYSLFLDTLVKIMKQVRNDRYLSIHANYFMREIRLKVYSQFLHAYRSVKLSTMAKTFGVSIPFLDRELSSFIATGRISCKIDKWGGVVETVQIDTRNQQYSQILKKGDALLNKLQRLSKVITM